MDAANVFQQAAGQQPQQPQPPLAVPVGFLQGLKISLWHDRTAVISFLAGILVSLFVWMIVTVSMRTPAMAEAEIKAKLQGDIATQAEIASLKAQIPVLQGEVKGFQGVVSELRVKLATCEALAKK